MPSGESVVKFIPAIGESDFRKLRELGAGYIDKTDFIREVLSDMSAVLLFPRPRRFGKTLNVSALGYFLRKSEEDLTHLFEGLNVARDSKAMAHFQKYPTVFLTFKDVKASSFAAALTGIREQIVEAYVEHRSLLDGGTLDPTTARRFQRVLDGEVSADELQYSLKWLSKALFERHKKGVVILIDEYDTPIQSGYLNGFFDEIVLFFRNFLSAALKDNNALFKGVLTGILRVSKENMFSGLNNIEVYSILSPQYATAFGFTEEEVAGIVDPDRLEEVRSWYNGYLFGGQVIYNPWSILNYVKKGTLAPYWVNTSSNELIERLATQHGMGLSAMSAALLNGETIDIPIDDNVVLRDIERQPDALWNFLLFSGYLKLVELRSDDMGDMRGKLTIPNIEVRNVYRTMFRHWLERAAPKPDMLDDLVQALLNGNAPKVQKLVERILLTVISFQDPAGKEPEKLYHGLVLGLLVYLEAHYEVRSNRESGYGRADVLMRPKTPGKPGVVMELKVRDDDETPEEVLADAAKQIRDRRYAAELEHAGASPVREYAMAFDGEQVWVKLLE
ncbi:MAG: AAA family ATPase [Polyangiaceae bacterium]|nr:AAA family ATPase [Polyangiaceae bacterium]